MGHFNELLGPAAGISRALAVTFGIQEQEGATTLSPELQPTFEITARPEFYHLLGGTLLWATNNLAAEVGAREESYFQNPLGSGVLAVVDYVLISSVLANSFVIGFLNSGSNGVADPSGAALVQRDFRRRGVAGVACRNRINPAAVGLTTWIGEQITVLVPAGTTVPVQLNVVVPPNWSVGVRPDADNEALICSWFARERPAAAAELV